MVKSGPLFLGRGFLYFASSHVLYPSLMAEKQAALVKQGRFS
jgi:hypothetical protein